MDEAFVRLEHLTKNFGSATAVDDLSVAVAKGESLTLLGPSGCGKTTTLRMIAGLETPDAGAIHIDGVPVVSVDGRINLPPERRKIGMVFQSYAIWPHMSVAQNVGFPLRLRRVSAAEIAERVKRALAMIGLVGFEDRPATRLSGGEQQRVALARALVYEPALLLLDEPLSNLDVKLREQMRLELKLLQNRLRLTVINVTHDQTEALSLSDRIIVLNHGKVEQIGAPRELYERPATQFVRDFLGKSVTLSGVVRGAANGRVSVALACSPAEPLDCPAPPGIACVPGTEVEISVRPEAVRLRRAGEPAEGGILKGVIEAILYQGDRSECEVRIGSQAILVYLPPQLSPAQGDPVELVLPPGNLRLWAK